MKEKTTAGGVKEISDLKDLVPDPRNANRGTERGLGLLEGSLRKFGAGRSILADRRGRVIAGSKTLDRAVELGLGVRVVRTDGRDLVVVQRQDLDLEENKAARELAIADNRVAELDLDWDPLVLKSLADEGIDLDAFFSADELAKLLEDVVEGPTETETPPLARATELQAKWQTSRGQLWNIPSKSKPGLVHRLFCGDATDREDVRRLVGDLRPAWMWTDPPFGVQYTGKTADRLTIQNDGAADLPRLLNEAFARAHEILAEGAPAYVVHPAGALSIEFGKAFLAAGFHWHQTLVWLKDSMVLGHSDFHYRHEPILYGWQPGKGRPWYGGREQVSVFEIPRPKASELHPTMKPPELVVQCLRNSSRVGDVGYEPFAGSGTTLVASERIGRLCLAMEIDPRYVAVALERLSLLGLEPRLEAEE